MSGLCVLLMWRLLCVGLGHAVWTDVLSVCVYGVLESSSVQPALLDPPQ